MNEPSLSGASVTACVFSGNSVQGAVGRIGSVLIAVFSVNLCVLCASVVNELATKRLTTEAQSTQRVTENFNLGHYRKDF